MSTIDSDLPDEERARLHADANDADKASRAPCIDDVTAMIRDLPDADIIPSELLAPIFDAIAGLEPIMRDQVAATLKAKVRRIKASTIEAEIDARIERDAPRGADDGEPDASEDAEGISEEAIAKMTRRCMAVGRPAIFCTNDEAAIVDKAIEALVKRAPWIFARDGRLVSVRKARVVEMSVENVRYGLNRVATFVDASGFKLKVIKGVPPFVDAMVRARGIYPGMRELAGVATTPILHGDGSVFATRGGYDAVTKLVYMPTDDYPALPDALPTLAEAQAAATEVLEVYVDFPTRDACDRSAILALALTLVGRAVIDGPCPAFLVVANAPRVGKGKVVETAAGIAYGTAIGIISEQPNDVELRKEITAYLRGGRRIIAIDNVRSVGGPVFDALLTARRWDGRTLGTSEMGEYDTGNLVVTITANNARLIGDAAQRVLPIRLHTKDPHPELRTDWTHSLPEHAIDEHVRLHVAALTVLRYGLTLTDPVPAWGSFEAWCQIIRRTVIAVLDVDPCDTRTADAAVDETGQMLVELLTALHAHGPGQEWTATRLLEMARGKRGKDEKGIERWDEKPDEVLAEALGNLLGDQRRAPHNVGAVLTPHKDRRVQLESGEIAALTSRLLHGCTRWSVTVAPATPKTNADTSGPGEPSASVDAEPLFE